MKRKLLVLSILIGLFVLVCSVSAYGETIVASGTARGGCPWRVNSDKELVFGSPGGTYVLGPYVVFNSNADGVMGYTSYDIPWAYTYINLGKVSTVRFEGNVRLVGGLANRDKSWLSDNRGTQNYGYISSIDYTNATGVGSTDYSGFFTTARGVSGLPVDQFPGTGVTKFCYTFSGNQTNMQNLVSQLDTSSGRYFLGTFHAYSPSSRSVDVSSWDMSHAVNISTMFSFAGLSSINVTGWDVSNVKQMSHVFSNNSWLQSLNLSDWDTSSALNMSGMFGGCENLRNLNISNFNTSNVLDMNYMFAYCKRFTSLDLTHFNTNKVKNMSRMFDNCIALKSLDVSTWDTASLENMSRMFGDCRSLTSLDVNHFDTDHVTDMSYVFNNCYTLRSLNVSNWNTANVTNMAGMFTGCSGISELNVSNFDVSNVTNMSTMFKNCSKITELDLSSWNTSNATNMTDMFRDCTYLKSVTLGEEFSFKGNGITNVNQQCKLPDVKTYSQGHYYSGKWISADGQFGPYTAEELRDNYTPEMAGTWVWETTDPIELSFAAPEEAAGSMIGAMVLTEYDYTIPTCRYGIYDYTFLYWDDGQGHQYEDEGIIEAWTYPRGSHVTLTAVFQKNEHPVMMEDGSFEFSIKAGVTAVFDELPSGTSCYVYEKTESGWILIKEVNSSGVIEALDTMASAFLNEYRDGSLAVQFVGMKNFDNEPALNGEYSFVLLDADEKILQVKDNIDGGAIIFDPIVYTADDSGEHTYIIRELVTDKEGVDFDLHDEIVCVTVGVNAPEVSTVAHTDNISDDGNKLADYVSNQYYTKVVTVPGATALHVEVTYTNPRGNFWIWQGAHDEVHTRVYNGEFNPNTAYKTYYSQSGKDQEYLHDTFDVAGDSLSILYYSYGYSSSQGYYPNGPYSDMVNYGYYMTISAGDLETNVEYDDDGVIFNNSSRPGLLFLAKHSIDDNVVPDSFYYDIELANEYGQAYVPDDGVLNYERRDGAPEDYSDLQIPIEKPTYTLTVNHIYYGASDRNMTETFELPYMGAFTLDERLFDDCVCINVDDTHLLKDGHSYKGAMGATDHTVTFKYSTATTVTGTVEWSDQNNLRGLRPDTFDIKLTSSGNVIASQSVSVADQMDDNANVWQLVFEGVPQYDTQGRSITWYPSYNLPANYQSGNSSGGLDILFTTATRHGKYRGVNYAIFSDYEVDIGRAVMPQTYTAAVSQYASQWPWYSDRANITKCRFIGEVNGNGAMTSMFADCAVLTEVDSTKFNTANATNLASMFSNCKLLTTLDTSNFETSSVTNMANMFYNCSALTALDVSGFDTANVTNMSQMFYNCKVVPELNVSGWDTTNVVNMASMFSGCSKVEALDVSHFKTSNVTTMASMFSNCSKLTALDVSGFDTSNVTNMSGMFSSCSNVTSLDVSHFNTAGVTSMSSMFSFCTKLASLDVSHFTTSNVTNMASMFYGCSSLPSLNVSNFDTTQVTNMYAMFYNCRGLTNLDVTNFTTSNVTSMSTMFGGCSGLTSLDVTGFDTAKVTSMYMMFYDCSGLTSLDVSSFNTSNVTSMGSMFSRCSGLTSLTVSNFDTTKVTGMGQMFSGCSGLTSLDVTSFVTTNVTDMSSMFMNCSGLSSIDVSHFVTSKVTTMNSMFNGCSGLTSLDVTGFDTSKATSMSYMFAGCSGLTSLNLLGFDTSKVTSFAYMFSGDTGLTSLDLSAFNSANVTSMTSMFAGCDQLATVYVSDLWVTTKVTANNSKNMFDGCVTLVGGNGTPYDASHLDKTYACVDSTSTPGYFTYKSH